MSYRVRDCIESGKWEIYKGNFLRKYDENSSRKVFEADLARIYEFLNEHVGKNLYEITIEDIKRNIAHHINKGDKPLQSRNAVMGYLGTMQRFFSHLHHFEHLITTHVFIEKIWNVTDFVNDFADEYFLTEEERKEAYPKDRLICLLEKIHTHIAKVTKRQALRLIQQSIYIQLALITGMKKKSLLDLEFGQFHNGKLYLEELEIILPKWTNSYVDLYRSIRGTEITSLFRKANGKKYQNNELIALDGILGNLCKDVGGLVDIETMTLSSESLRSTAILDMVRTGNNLYYILKLSGLQNSAVNDFDRFYISVSGGEEKWSTQTNEEINKLIRKLSYYHA